MIGNNRVMGLFKFEPGRDISFDGGHSKGSSTQQHSHATLNQQFYHFFLEQFGDVLQAFQAAEIP